MTYPTEQPTRHAGAWRRAAAFVREALRDSDTDFTTGSTGRALGLLAIPMVLEMSMEAIFAVVDIAFVSRLGTEAVAAVGITEALVTVLYAIAIGLGTGATAMVSRRIGAGDPDEAARVTAQAIWIGALLSLIIGVFGVASAADLLRLMGAERSVVETGTGFTATLLGGSGSILFLFLLSAAFRGAGDAPIALRALMLANGINIVLDPCLIFGAGPFPELGVTGAAVATTIGRSAGVAYLAYYLCTDNGRLRVETRHLPVAPALVRRLLLISAGGIGQFLIATSSWIALMRIVALYGSAPIAAYTIALRMLEFAFLPAWGLGNAAATLVGQNLGAGHPRRAERSAWQAARYNVLFMTVLGLVSIIAAPTMVGWFSDDPEIVRYGTNCLRIMGIGYPAYAAGMIVIQALNGAGDTRSPSIMNFICFWLVQIPVAYWLATTAGLGPNGVFTAIVVSETLLTIIAILVFRTGRWQSRQA
jgi:putative MATE family efflux protein